MRDPFSGKMKSKMSNIVIKTVRINTASDRNAKLYKIRLNYNGIPWVMWTGHYRKIIKVHWKEEQKHSLIKLQRICHRGYANLTSLCVLSSFFFSTISTAPFTLFLTQGTNHDLSSSASIIFRYFNLPHVRQHPPVVYYMPQYLFNLHYVNSPSRKPDNLLRKNWLFWLTPSAS